MLLFFCSLGRVPDLLIIGLTHSQLIFLLIRKIFQIVKQFCKDFIISWKSWLITGFHQLPLAQWGSFELA